MPVNFLAVTDENFFNPLEPKQKTITFFLGIQAIEIRYDHYQNHQCQSQAHANVRRHCHLTL